MIPWDVVDIAWRPNRLLANLHAVNFFNGLSPTVPTGSRRISRSYDSQWLKHPENLEKCKRRFWSRCQDGLGLRPKNSWSQHSHYIPLLCWVPDLVQGETGPIFDGESHYLGLLGSLLSLIVDLRELAQNGDLKQSLGWNPQFTQLAITQGILSILHFSTNQCFAGSHSSTTCSTAGPVTKP